MSSQLPIPQGCRERQISDQVVDQAPNPPFDGSCITAATDFEFPHEERRLTRKPSLGVVVIARPWLGGRGREVR